MQARPRTYVRETLVATLGFRLDKACSGYSRLPQVGPRIFPKVGTWITLISETPVITADYMTHLFYVEPIMKLIITV